MRSEHDESRIRICLYIRTLTSHLSESCIITPGLQYTDDLHKNTHTHTHTHNPSTTLPLQRRESQSTDDKKNYCKSNLKSPWNQNGHFLFFMEYCSVYSKWFIGAHHYCVKFMFLVILNQNIFSSLLQHLFSSLMTRAGQPVTHMRSTNSKPQPSNQFPTDKIKPRPTFVLVWEAFHSDIRHNREEDDDQLPFHAILKSVVVFCFHNTKQMHDQIRQCSIKKCINNNKSEKKSSTVIDVFRAVPITNQHQQTHPKPFWP